MTGKATEPAKAIAASAPSSPFAADFAAGQGGLMIPAAAIGIATRSRDSCGDARILAAPAGRSVGIAL